MDLGNKLRILLQRASTKRRKNVIDANLSFERIYNGKYFCIIEKKNEKKEERYDDVMLFNQNLLMQ